jgi:hypothetical protein
LCLKVVAVNAINLHTSSSLCFRATFFTEYTHHRFLVRCMCCSI